jgi:hypothetical protein
MDEYLSCFISYFMRVYFDFLASHFRYKNLNSKLKFNALLTTYEILLKDKVQFNYLFICLYI